MTTRRHFLDASALAALSATGLSVHAQAQKWPNLALKIIEPFPPGGTSDVIARKRPT